ncbi:PP2C family serine/threonine-protein phosphatase [Marinococcus sp. PL1-022]|uniref:PP2C family serine/threonine-protein phosphatase n=1 Tax=Marinococcus sp. PL1-022 TaxID=3095363 RepID=UPI00263805C3|nr:PP2C family serine/threonine-protein phosphatase [Marinococcus sp. PL1-022]MDX6153734.1 PP2C family serine/threonine-protein phosphatase [Marinococcus sp. PL1-022]
MTDSTSNTQVNTAVFQKTKPGNRVCGDSYLVVETEDFFLCSVTDGLGSGEGARQSAEIAMNIIRAHKQESIPMLLERCNRALVSERGVVLAIIKVCYQEQELTYGSIGNITCYISADNEEIFRPIPTKGYLSGRKFQYRLEYVPFDKGISFVLHSDGMTVTPEDQRALPYMRSVEEYKNRLAEKAENENDDVTLMVGALG